MRFQNGMRTIHIKLEGVDVTNKWPAFFEHDKTTDQLKMKDKSRNMRMKYNKTVKKNKKKNNNYITKQEHEKINSKSKRE